MADRTLAGGLALKGDWDLGEDGWKDDFDLNLLWLSVIVQGRFIDLVASEPGSPAEGDIYVLDETHGTHPNAVAAYDEGAWHYKTPLTGWRLYNTTEATFYQFNGTVWAADAVSAALYYNYGSFAVASITASEILMDHIVTVAHTLADDFVGCKASVGTNPAATWTADVKKNGASVGSLAISTGGVVTFTTTGTTVSMAPGDLLTVVAPASADASIARVRFTFLGIR